MFRPTRQVRPKPFHSRVFRLSVGSGGPPDATPDEAHIAPMLDELAAQASQNRIHLLLRCRRLFVSGGHARLMVNCWNDCSLFHLQGLCPYRPQVKDVSLGSYPVSGQCDGANVLLALEGKDEARLQASGAEDSLICDGTRAHCVVCSACKPAAGERTCVA